LTDSEYSAYPIEERIRHVARAEQMKGVVEVPHGSNWGDDVRKYLLAAGQPEPAFWCAAFVFWCLVEAGAPISLRKAIKYPASTYFLWKWAADTGRLMKKPLPGSIGIYNGPNGGHCWIELDAENVKGTLQGRRTIEGNTNPKGGRDGYGVFERRRRGFPKGYPRTGYIDVRGL
jgi:hypothetical protein